MAQALTSQNGLSKSLGRAPDVPVQPGTCVRTGLWGGPGGPREALSEREHLGARTMTVLTSGSYWLNISFTDQLKKTFSCSPESKQVQVKRAVRYHFHTRAWQGDLCPDSHSGRSCCPPARSAFSRRSRSRPAAGAAGKWGTKACISAQDRTPPGNAHSRASHRPLETL